MRALLLTAAGVLLLAVVPGAAQTGNPIQYSVQVEQDEQGQKTVYPVFREHDGKRALYVLVRFKVLRVGPDGGPGEVAIDVNKDEIVVEEDRKKVEELEILQPRAQRLTTVLAIDISGSMASRGKMDEAKKAAHAFLDQLDARADTGLILFDHLIRHVEKPVGDPARFLEHRARLRRLIDQAQPNGGTAYLDATQQAVQMLAGVQGRKAVLLMTDGQDMNSKTGLAAVIAQAQAAAVPVYTLGIGEPGKNEPVTTVLVLDRSGSMKGKANDTDRQTKIEALREAAGRFVDVMIRRPSARTTLLPFSDKVGRPQPDGFSRDEAALRQVIAGLKPGGGTLLYDATCAGIETLMAGGVEGKKAVVVLTDGKDESPGSRRSDRAVIARAREVGVPLYMLGLGRSREINEPVMRRMASETRGTYHHADSQARLFEIFEKLSIDLHDDGIDEESLRRLAKETGGKYIPARDVSKLHLIYAELAEELQSTYTATFRSGRSSHDGTARAIDVSVVRNGIRVSDVGSTGYNLHGVVVPEMHILVYLAGLGVLGTLLLLPAGLRRLRRSPGGG